VRLAEASDELGISEGIESGLSVQQATGLPVWAALSTGGLTGLGCEGES
jgi:putative DNA primase/helicase